ncbi:acyl-CoA thioesterase [Janthinobacterium agaricidamnosum]|uniref:Thioesterase n=1 Tax=Janthinobacterium agaricidamnosum NBRC 102515 = DSM 9628 TaxID=1349767 RepID=W0V369_9BURK|nr:acyl-CoA thioesterase [Janthinobacterium agaricidamnosum]CDG82025.1 thioesterase [Janthinobacterium agaricidamnosum NBRC 102515 = DSM 9628]
MHPYSNAVIDTPAPVPVPDQPAAANLHDGSADKKTGLTFRHNLTIYLKDSNAYGNTYFARYFEWQGVCRERWFYECIARDMLQAHGVFITKHAEQDYLQETFPFQEISCEVNAYRIKRCSFWLEFRFFADGQQVSSGRQHIVFANHDKRITALPELVIKRIERYQLAGTEIRK